MRWHGAVATSGVSEVKDGAPVGSGIEEDEAVPGKVGPWCGAGLEGGGVVPGRSGPVKCCRR